jgi:hypothetical protein
VLAAGLAGYAAYVVSALPGEIRALRAKQESDDLEARVRTLERRASEAAALAPATVAATEAPRGLATAPAGSTGPATTTSVAPVTVEDLQKRVESLEATARGALGLADDAPLGKDAARGGRGGLALGPLGARIPTVYGSTDDAAKDLELTDAQRADFDRAAADARRELEELRKTPDADGNTWEAAQKEAFKAENGVFRFDMSKIESFREKTIPGRSESFGAADRRIRETAKRRMRDTLTPEQREKYDKAMVDPMLGGGGGGFSLTTATLDVVSDDSGK